MSDQFKSTAAAKVKLLLETEKPPPWEVDWLLRVDANQGKSPWASLVLDNSSHTDGMVDALVQKVGALASAALHAAFDAQELDIVTRLICDCGVTPDAAVLASLAACCVCRQALCACASKPNLARDLSAAAVAQHPLAVVVESAHPYHDRESLTQQIVVRGATAIFARFDDRTTTEQGCDTVSARASEPRGIDT